LNVKGLGSNGLKFSLVSILKKPREMVLSL